MPGLPTITDVYRMRIIWNSYLGVRPVNVFHVRGSGYNEADMGLAVGSLMTTGMFGCLGVNYEFDQLGVTSLDGVSAEQIVSIGATVTGDGGSGQQIPNSAGIVSLHSGQKGARGRGRMYVGPVVEASAVNGQLDGGDISVMITAWTDFLAALIAATPTIDLGIASYKHADFHAATSIQIKPVLGTQRRRQEQLL